MKKKAAPERVAYLAQLAQRTPHPELARLYGMSMSAVARKSVLRLDRETKARFCKRCSAPRSLDTTTWRIEDLSKKANRPTLVTVCVCGAVTRRPMYKLEQTKQTKSE